MQQKDNVPFPCHVNCETHKLSVGYSIYVNFPSLIATLIVVVLLNFRWQGHPCDSQLWTNAKPMHGVRQMNLLQQ